MWTYPHKTADFLKFTKSLTENFIFCVVNIIGFTTEFLPVSRILYINQHLTQISIYSSLQKSIFWSKRLELSAQELLRDNVLLEHRTFFKLLVVEEVPRNSLVNCLPKQFLDTKEEVFYCKGRLFTSETRYVVSL